MLAILAGFTRYCHVERLRNDAACAALLGLTKVVSDEYKNQWGWCGFVTQKLKPTRAMARLIAIVAKPQVIEISRPLCVGPIGTR